MLQLFKYANSCTSFFVVIMKRPIPWSDKSDDDDDDSSSSSDSESDSNKTKPEGIMSQHLFCFNALHCVFQYAILVHISNLMGFFFSNSFSLNANILNFG